MIVERLEATSLAQQLALEMTEHVQDNEDWRLENIRLQEEVDRFRAELAAERRRGFFSRVFRRRSKSYSGAKDPR